MPRHLTPREENEYGQRLQLLMISAVLGTPFAVSGGIVMIVNTFTSICRIPASVLLQIAAASAGLAATLLVILRLEGWLCCGGAEIIRRKPLFISLLATHIFLAWGGLAYLRSLGCFWSWWDPMGG
ncbi:MAG: hypothetical protein H7Y60_09170 [Rhodospirillaceae bacterium]|nr:hypothetical protein [Rhodospirillales bacterium]